MLVGVGGSRGARRDPELGEDVAHVALDGFFAEHQLVRNGAVRLARVSAPPARTELAAGLTSREVEVFAEHVRAERTPEERSGYRNG